MVRLTCMCTCCLCVHVSKCDPNNTINTNGNKAAHTHTWHNYMTYRRVTPTLFVPQYPPPPTCHQQSCQRLWNTCNNTAFLPVRQQKHSESPKTVQGQRCIYSFSLYNSSSLTMLDSFNFSHAPPKPPPLPLSTAFSSTIPWQNGKLCMTLPWILCRAWMDKSDKETTPGAERTSK